MSTKLWRAFTACIVLQISAVALAADDAPDDAAWRPRDSRQTAPDDEDAPAEDWRARQRKPPSTAAQKRAAAAAKNRATRDSAPQERGEGGQRDSERAASRQASKRLAERDAPGRVAERDAPGRLAERDAPDRLGDGLSDRRDDWQRADRQQDERQLAMRQAYLAQNSAPQSTPRGRASRPQVRSADAMSEPGPFQPTRDRMMRPASMQMDGPPAPPPQMQMQPTPMPSGSMPGGSGPGAQNFNGRSAPYSVEPPQNESMPYNYPNYPPQAQHGYDTQVIDDGEMGDWQGGCGCNNCGNCGNCCNSGYGGFGGYGRCGCRGPIYARGEYLSWWLKGDSEPALVTTSPADTARTAAGVLGQPGTSVLFGDQSLNNRQRSGARVTLGMWITPTVRIEGEWFGLGQQNSGYTGSSDGAMILARPFFNLSPTVAAQDSNVLSYPGELAGTVTVSDVSRFMGAGIGAAKTVMWSNYGRLQRRVDFLYGFRYLRLYDSLSIHDSTMSIDQTGLTAVPFGAVFTSTDSFRTSNNFYGLNLGAMSEYRLNRWRLISIGRLGIGATTERVSINGSSTATVSGASTTSAGGLLAQPSNIGNYSHEGFALVPQLELKMAYDLTPNLTVNVGYDLLYWSRVVRPGNQIDTQVNTTQSAGGTLSGVPGPLYTIRETDLWAQGVSAGGEWRF